MKCVEMQPRYTAGKLLAEKGVINVSPEYQRESGVWSKAKQQLFIDTILNGYDIPKLYFHDVRGDKSHFNYAVVDGKQRLHAVWAFLQDDFELERDVEIPKDARNLTDQKAYTGSRCSELDDYWRNRVKDHVFDIIVIQDADEYDIEELFLRLNNGESLTGAEQRNGFGGDMCKLIREIGAHKFFKEYTTFSQKRLQHLETAAKFLLMEHTAGGETGEIYCILKKQFLDTMARENRKMTEVKSNALKKAVEGHLNFMTRVFDKKDPLLKRLSTPQLFYVFCREVPRLYGHRNLHSKIHTFIGQFWVRRTENLGIIEEAERDPELLDFDRLMSQNNDKESMKKRVKTMTRLFLEDNPDVEKKDNRRLFNSEEKYVIWVNGGKKCANCNRSIEIDEMDADHIKSFAHGGKTTLKNARALCITCNRGGVEAMG